MQVRGANMVMLSTHRSALIGFQGMSLMTHRTSYNRFWSLGVNSLQVRKRFARMTSASGSLPSSTSFCLWYKSFSRSWVVVIT